MNVLFQREFSGPEARAVKLHCLMQSPAYTVRNVDLAELANLDLKSFDLIVGSVEFMRESFEKMGVKQPPNLSYPADLTSYLGRTVSSVEERFSLSYAHERMPCFVKPQMLKAFTGFVYRGLDHPYDEHDREQLEVFLSHQGDIWISEAIELLCEWRFYILDGTILGQARYDPEGLDDAPEPDLRCVQGAIKDFSSGPSAYTLDFGVTSHGQTVLIEANDAWAIGLYGKALSAAQYFEFLYRRFSEIKGPALN